MKELQIPTDLLAVIRRDIRPIRPLASPSRRAFAMIPLGVLLIFATPLYWGWRENLHQFPTWISWGLSILETLAGLLVLAGAFREAVPGRELALRSIIGLLAVPLLGFVVITLFTNSVVSTSPPASDAGRLAWDCLASDAPFALPALVPVAWLIARALPRRSALTGALCGLGIGLMSDAGMRLFCWISEPIHVLISHGGAVVLLMLLGSACAVAIEKIKARSALGTTAWRQ